LLFALLVEPISGVDLDKLPSFEEKRILFLLVIFYEPNWNAVQYLKETLWPLIKCTYLRLFECGAYPSQKYYN
jgi:hypothetical protein